ncbi:unnamed protein product [Lathyrus oleraceus]
MKSHNLHGMTCVFVPSLIRYHKDDEENHVVSEKFQEDPTSNEEDIADELQENDMDDELQEDDIDDE